MGASHRKRPRWKVAGRQSSSVSVLLPTGALQKGLHPDCPDRGSADQGDYGSKHPVRPLVSRRGRAVATCFSLSFFRNLRETSPSRSVSGETLCVKAIFDVIQHFST